MAFNITQAFEQIQLHNPRGWLGVFEIGFCRVITAIIRCLSAVPVFPPYSPSLVFCLLAGERVLCFHGPLLYEAKVRRPSVPLCVWLRANIHFVSFCVSVRKDQHKGEADQILYSLQRMEQKVSIVVVPPSRPFTPFCVSISRTVPVSLPVLWWWQLLHSSGSPQHFFRLNKILRQGIN